MLLGEMWEWEWLPLWEKLKYAVWPTFKCLKSNGEILCRGKIIQIVCACKDITHTYVCTQTDTNIWKRKKKKKKRDRGKRTTTTNTCNISALVLVSVKKKKKFNLKLTMAKFQGNYNIASARTRNFSCPAHWNSSGVWPLVSSRVLLCTCSCPKLFCHSWKMVILW